MRLDLEGEWVLDGDGAERQLLQVREVLVRRRTRYQRLEIVDTVAFGRMLLLDGQVQSSERDEMLYHEALVQPAMLLARAPERVLILGGGEGATLREALRHASVRDACMVDIDGEVVRACREHLPMLGRGSFEDPRARLVIGDALDEIGRPGAPFDVILQDVTDPLEEGPAARLFESAFFARVSERLAADGLLVVQCGSASLTQLAGFRRAVASLREAFPCVIPYVVSVPSFGAPWGFALAARSKREWPGEEWWETRLRARSLELGSLDGASLQALAALPPHLRRALATGG